MTVLSPARSQQPLITTTVPIVTVATVATGTATTLTTTTTTVTLGHVGLSYSAGGSVSSSTIMAADNSNLMMRLHESIKQKEEFLKSPLPNVQQQQQSSQYMQMQHFFPSTMVVVSAATTFSSSPSHDGVGSQQLATLSSSMVTSTCCAPSSTFLSAAGTVSSLLSSTAMLPLSNNNNVNLVTASRGGQLLTQSRNLSAKRSSMAVVSHYHLPHSLQTATETATAILSTTIATTTAIQSSCARELLVTNCDIHYPSLVMTSCSNNNNNNNHNASNNSNKNYNKTMTTMMTMPLNRGLQFQRHTINGSVVGKNIAVADMLVGGRVGGVGSSSVLLHSANNISNIHRNIAAPSMSGSKTITGVGGTILRDKTKQLFVDDGSGGLLETMAASTSTTLQETGVTNQV